MDNVKFVFQNDTLIKMEYLYTQVDGRKISKGTVIIDKDTFIECYNKWIKGETDESGVDEISKQ